MFDGQIAAESDSRIAGHLLRELLSAVEQVLLPFGYKKPKAGDHPTEVNAILQSLQLPEGYDVSSLRKTLAKHFASKQNAPPKWKAIMGSLGLTTDHEIFTLADGLELHAIAHRSNLDAAPPLENIRQDWERFQRLLALLLDAYEKSYASAYAKINASIKAHDLDAFRKSVPQNGATHAYFFEHISGDEWFERLQASEMLRRPPAGGGWAALGYLRREAAQHPEAVEKILLAIPSSDNEFVLMGMIDAARVLPSERAVRVLQKVGSYACTLRPDSFVPDELARAASMYAKTHSAAVRSVILPFLALSATSGEEVGSEKLVARLGVHSYATMATGPLQTVIAAEPRPTLESLLPIFLTALEGEFGPEGDTFSSMWRSAIEPHDQNHHFEPLPYLLDAVRDAAEQACHAEPGAAPDIVRSLMSTKWNILRRLALHVARAALPASRDVAHELALAPETVQSGDGRHEARLLLREVFPTLTAAEKQAITERILAGPVEEPDEERARWWKVRRLAWIEGHLTPEVRALYDELRGAAAKPGEEADFDVYTTGMFHGPTSPRTPDELRDASLEEIVQLLRTWIPPKGFAEPTREGLGRSLHPVVEKRAQEFASAAETFTALPATYLGAILGGLTDAVRAGVVIDWEPVLRLCSWVVSQPRAITRSGGEPDDDPHWGWTRAQIGRLLREGYGSGPHGIPRYLKAAVWGVLLPLTDDPDPDQSRDQNDPFSTAMNSTRGVAMEAVVGYAAWQRGGYFRPPDQPGAAFHDLPEVERLLLAHLDVAREPSLAIRAVYGRFLGLLDALAPGWVCAHIELLAPMDEPAYADVLWQSYLVYGRHYPTALLNSLRPLVLGSMDALREREPVYQEFPRKLAEFVVTAYLKGEESLGAESLLDRFFASADAEARCYALTLVPQLLSEATAPEELTSWVERAVALWGWRLDVGEDGAEFKSVGLWAPSEYFDAGWRLQQLADAVARGGVPQFEHQVVETLAKLAEEHLPPVLRVVELLVEHSATYMDAYRLMYSGELQSILALGVASGEVATSAHAREIANTLIARGFTQLLDLTST